MYLFRLIVIVAAVLVTAASCGDRAYSDLQWTEDGIQGYQELDLENLRPTSYYLFKYSFWGSLEEVRRIDNPESPGLDPANYWIISPAEEENFFNRIGFAGQPVSYDQEWNRLEKRNEEDGTQRLIYYTGKNPMAVASDAISKAHRWDGNQYKVSSEGFEGSPITDIILGIHAQLHKFDDQGRTIETSYLDEQGKPMTPYLPIQSSTVYSYEGDSPFPSARTARNAEGEPMELEGGNCFKIKLSYDEAGNLLSEECLGKEDEKLTFSEYRTYHKKEGSITKSGTFLIKYMDSEGKAAPHSKKEPYTEKEIHGLATDSEIRIVYRNSLEPDSLKITEKRIQQLSPGQPTGYSCWKQDEPTLCDEGYHKLVMKYSEQGRLIEYKSLNTEGNLMLPTDQDVARTTFEYDSLGRLTKVRKFGSDDKLALAGKDKVAGRNLEYEPTGHRISRVVFIGTDEKPALPDEHNFSEVRTEYQSDKVEIQCYLDPEGNSVARNDSGAHCHQIALTEDFLLQEIRYLNEKKEPVNHKDLNIHIVRWKLDDRSWPVESLHFDTEEKPAGAGQVKIHKIEREFTNFGRLKSVSYFDKDGKPAVDGYRAHRTEYSYEKGRMKTVKDYNVAGNVIYTFNY